MTDVGRAITRLERWVGELSEGLEKNTNGESYVASCNRAIYSKVAVIRECIEFIRKYDDDADVYQTYWRDG